MRRAAGGCRLTEPPPPTLGPELVLPGEQQACRVYGLGLARKLVAADLLAEHLTLDSSLFVEFGEPTDALLSTLTAAGFDDELALRCLALLTNICMAFAHDVVQVSRSGDRPRRLMAAEALRDRETDLATFARIVALSIDTYDHEQLELSVALFVHGAAALLAEQSTGVPPHRT